MARLLSPLSSPCRSWLFVPGNNQKYLTKANDGIADVLLLDLEDGVPPDDKARGRAMLREYLETPSNKVLFVRVNALSTGLVPEDLDAVVRPGLDGICLPKVEAANDVRRLADQLGELEAQRGLSPGQTRILCAIESARGLLNAYQIATTDPRVVGLMFGAEDFALDLGLMTNRRHEAADLAYARSAVVVAATGAGVLSVDGVYPHLLDEDGLRADTRRSLNHGFSGKSTFSPRQLPILHEIYEPGVDEVDFSRRVIAAFRAAGAASAGSAVVDGQLVHRPIALRAERVLARSQPR